MREAGYEPCGTDKDHAHWHECVALYEFTGFFGRVRFCRTLQLGYVYKIDVNKNSAVYISRWPIINCTDVRSEQEIIDHADISTSVFESLVFLEA